MKAAWNVVRCIAGALACVTGTAQAEVVKLSELEARALSRRPELAATQARIRQADADVELAKSAYWPTVAANVDGTLAPGRDLVEIEQDGREYLVAGALTLDEARAFWPHPRYGVSLQARGNLYDFGRTSSAVEAARAKQRASQADAEARAQSVVLEVRGAYLRWAIATALWNIADEAQRGARARADRITGLIAEGAAPTAAQTPVALQANAAATEAERAALELDTARLELAFLSARDLGPEARPEPGLLEPDPQPPAAKPGGASVVVEALERARFAAEARRRMQSMADAPTLGFRLSAGIEGQAARLFPSYGVGIGLSVPLWDGGATSASEAGARAAASELAAQAATERAREKHLAERRALQTQHAARLVALAGEAFALADARVRQLQGGETLGSAEQSELAAADADRVRARTELVRARAVVAQLKLGLP